MVNIHVYTRICRFCTSVLTLDAYQHVLVRAIIGIITASSVLIGPVTDSVADSSCPSPSYYIESIETSALADTSEDARNEAMSNGLIMAWTRLQQRLLISGQDEPELTSAEEILPLLDYTRLVNETVLPSRYQAVFDYCFDRLKMRDFFAKSNLRHAELMSGSILVLPIWIAPDGPHLWRTPNPWAESWVRILSKHDGLLDLRLPSSLATERAIDVKPLMEHDPDTLSKAASLEETERVLLMVMTPQLTDTGLTVDIDANLFNKSGKFDAKAYSLKNAALNTEDLTSAIDGIALTLLAGVEDVWRKTNVVNRQDSGVLILSVNAGSLKEWRSSLDILGSLSPVERLSIIRLASDGGLVQIKLSGSITSLNYALEPHGLAVKEQGTLQQSYLSLARIVN